MRRNTKRIVHILVVMVASLWFEGACLYAAGSVTAIGNAGKPGPSGTSDIPSIELPVPPDDQAKRYLGLSGTGNFKIGQIDTQILIVQVYSFYCPHCQRSAAQVNDLYQRIQGRPDLKEKIKMIGIGVGNSVYEVDSYRKRYNVSFPLFPDVSTEISQRLGVRGTPTFIGLKANDKGIQEKFYFEEGGFQDIEKFLSEIIRLSGMK